MEDYKKRRLLTPKYDVIFKALFGRKDSEEILQGFLNAVLTEEVTNISLNENPILLQEYPNEKLGILDVVAKINNREIVDIEIQLKDQHNIEKRTLQYWGKKYSEQLKKGEDYNKLKKTIIIVLLDFELKETRKFKDAHTEWVPREKRDTRIEIFKDMEIHIIEMPKAKKYKETEEELRRWVEFILNPESEGVKMSIKEDKALNKAYEKLEEISNDEYLREIEELKWKAISDENSIKNWERNEGIQEGILEVAKNLLEDEMDINKVMKLNGLTMKEVKSLI